MTLLLSLTGIATLLGLAFLLSENRSAVNYRTVTVAFLIQAGLAALILYVPFGKDLLGGLVSAVQHVINYANEGIEFLFGDIGRGKIGFTIAFHVLPVIIFFSALMSTLYYLGVMQRVISVFGGWLHKLLQTSHIESMSAVSNVFIGHTEAPLVVRPYLAGMTQSELFAVMTGGCATIAGAVMAGYAAMGVDLNYLITASFMAAPGGLLMAKIVKPEVDSRDVEVQNVHYSEAQQPVNIFEAIGNGALDGLKLALNVGAMLLAFVAMVALLNGLISGVGGLFGYDGVTLQGMLGVAFSPLAYVLGVPWSEAVTAGSLIGQKLVVNEFIAYVDFVEIRDTLSARTQVIVTFALCGFANLSSIAILLGGLGSIVPERRQDIARMGLKAVLAGTLSNLMSATLAGLFFQLQI